MANAHPFPATTVKFEAAPLKLGAEWQVVATYPTDRREQIAGFKNEAEAITWIGSPQCLALIKARGYE
jgi:hypothetical protein